MSAAAAALTHSSLIAFLTIYEQNARVYMEFAGGGRVSAMPPLPVFPPLPPHRHPTAAPFHSIPFCASPVGRAGWCRRVIVQRTKMNVERRSVSESEGCEAIARFDNELGETLKKIMEWELERARAPSFILSLSHSALPP